MVQCLSTPGFVTEGHGVTLPTLPNQGAGFKALGPPP